MLQAQGFIKLNTSDTIVVQNPLIKIEAIFKYPGWATEITASMPVAGGHIQLNIDKKYVLDGAIFTQYDTGDGLFASNLSSIIENYVAADLLQINPEAIITVL